MRFYYVYILASKRNGTLYIGMTNDIDRRLREHKSVYNKGFTSKYNVYRLVHLERYTDPKSAINREKQLKNWRRKWKLDLIEKENPHWNDLSH